MCSVAFGRLESAVSPERDLDSMSTTSGKPADWLESAVSPERDLDPVTIS